MNQKSQCLYDKYEEFNAEVIKSHSVDRDTYKPAKRESNLDDFMTAINVLNGGKMHQNRIAFLMKFAISLKRSMEDTY